MKRVKVPYFKQKTPYTCGPAVLKMVYSFFGKEISEKKLVKQLKTSREGTNHSSLIKCARRNGFYCFIHDDSSIHQIRGFISKNLPVIVNYIEPKDNEGHYAVVIGFTHDKIVLQDPWDGKNLKLSFREFMKRWHDSSFSYKKWMMVLSRKKFNLGRQYAPLAK